MLSVERTMKSKGKRPKIYRMMGIALYPVLCNDYNFLSFVIVRPPPTKKETGGGWRVARLLRVLALCM
jgi:hypothetical protein